MVNILPPPVFGKKNSLAIKQREQKRQQQITVPAPPKQKKKKKKTNSTKELNLKPGFEAIHDNYEPIVGNDPLNVNELLKDLDIKAVRENRKIQGKTFTIIHERQKQESNVTTVLDDTVALFDQFLDECLIPMESKHPEAFQDIVSWIEKFGNLKKKRKDD